METIRTNVENFIKKGDLQNAIYLLIDNITTLKHRIYLCTLLGELNRTEHDRHLIQYDEYNRTINRVTNSLLDLLAEIELTKTTKPVKKGYAVHNIPSAMTLGKKILCEVKISDEQIETIATKFKNIYEDIYLRDEMEVNLTATDDAFTIEPLNKLTLQSVVSGEINSWKFWLTGNKDGNHALILTITGITIDVLNKTKKREDVTVVEINVALNKEQNLEPECALPNYKPTHIYYGQHTTAQRVLFFTLKNGMAQIALILGVVMLVGMPGLQPPISKNSSSNDNKRRIVLPDAYPFNDKETDIALIDDNKAFLEVNNKGQRVLVIPSNESSYPTKIKFKSVNEESPKLYNMTIRDLNTNKPYVDLTLIPSNYIKVYKRINVVLNEFTSMKGKVIPNDTNQFKLLVNGIANNFMMYNGDTLKPLLEINRLHTFKVIYAPPRKDSIISILLRDNIYSNTQRVDLELTTVRGKVINSSVSNTKSTVTLRFPNKFFTNPVITINKGEQIKIASINNNSLKLVLPLHKTFNIKAKEDNHLGQIKVTTNKKMILKDFDCESIPYEIHFKLSDKLRLVKDKITVNRKYGEVDVRFDKDECIVKFFNTNKTGGSEQIDLLLENGHLLICCFKGKLVAGQIKEWDCGEICRECEEQDKAQVIAKKTKINN